MKFTGNVALFSLIALGLAAVAIGGIQEGRESDLGNVDPTNIVFILADDLAWSDLGAYGHRWNSTPNLDSLAREGVRFTQAYASAAICSASRASILTGRTPARLHFEFVTKPEPGTQEIVPKQALVAPPFTLNLPLQEETLPEHLKRAGYGTAFFGKWHLNAHYDGVYLGWDPVYGPKGQGFDVATEDFGIHPYSYRVTGKPPVIDEPGRFPVDSMTQRAVAYLKSDPSEPFVLEASYFFVHTPVETSCRWLLDKYDRLVPSNSPNRDRRIAYAAFLEEFDHYVGELLQALDDAGHREDTLVVFTSDNGGHPEYTGNGPLRGSKWNLYEGGIRVPLIARWPGKISPDTVSDPPIIGYDLVPTFAAAAGLSEEIEKRPIDGASLLAALSGEGNEELSNRELYWHFPYYHPETDFGKARSEIGVNDFEVSQTRPHSAIRRGNCKLLYFYESDHVELYDLGDDLSETHDLSGTQSELANDLKRRLFEYLDSVGARYPSRS